MKAWQLGLLFIFIAIILSVWIYYDAKTVNVLPWYIVLSDAFLFLTGLLMVRFGKH